MKRGSKILVFVFLSFILISASIAFVSAGFFSNIFSKQTGEVVNPTPRNFSCIDSDGGKNYYAKGTITVNGQNVFEDYCFNDVFTTNTELEEGVCYDSGWGKLYYQCPNGCSNGACVNSTDIYYPAPFIVNGIVDVAIIYGTQQGASAMEIVQAGNIQDDLKSKMTTTLGNTLVIDSQLDSVKTKGWIVVGTPCSNSAVFASLGLTLATCSSGASKLGIGPGQFTIQSIVGQNGNPILLVVGYTVGDVVNATKYLLSHQVKTSIGYKYISTATNNQTTPCTDTDGGINVNIRGYCKDSRGTFSDGCLAADGSGPSSTGAYVDEAFCMTDEMVQYCKQYNSAEYCDNLPRECYSAPMLPPSSAPGLAWSYFPQKNEYFCKNGCLNGACISDNQTNQTTTCTDSDGGINYYLKGTLTNSGSQTNYLTLTHDDFCWSNSSGQYVNEFYCSNGYQASKLYLCPDGCLNGACIQPQNQTNRTNTCTDSDGGINYYVKGEAVSSNQSIEGRIDCCKMSSDMGPCVIEGPYLHEATCNTSGVPSSIFYACPNGCRDGVCLPVNQTNTTNPVCTDSDGGKNYFKKGNITVNGQKVFEDYCFNDVFTTNTELEEGVCYNESNAVWGELYYQCPNGCSNGACLPDNQTNQTGCTIDSDCGERGVCREGVCYLTPIVTIYCHTNADCEAGYQCSNTSCVQVKPARQNTSISCDSGCVLNNRCYPFGYRKSGQYCSENSQLTAQVGNNEPCENNFECKTNACINNQCINQGLFQRFLNWFKIFNRSKK
jgi:hypothetical protein